MKPVVLEGNCLDIVKNMLPSEYQFDGVITSPPYNMGKDPNHGKGKLYNSYDDYIDRMEYLGDAFMLFSYLDHVINPNGTICMVVSYSSKDAILPYDMIHEIKKETVWTVVETIGWIKNSSTPLNTSPRNLSRRMELIFVFARKSEQDSYITNKPKGLITNNQQFYKYTPNVIFAKNNDSHPNAPTHGATYSKELVKKIMDIYYPKDSLILDPYAGLGTTITAAIESGRNAIGIELDPEYVVYANKQIDDLLSQQSLDNFF